MIDDSVKWEYLVETINTEYVLNENRDIDTSRKGEMLIQSRLDPLGREAWELVAFLPALPATSYVMELYKNPWVYYAVFKRPVRNGQDEDA